MLILAVDPGLTTGVASLHVGDDGSLSASAFQTTNVLQADSWIDRRAANHGNVVLLIEDFTGGGYRTKESNHTLKVIGFFYYAYGLSLKVVMRTNQQRLQGTPFVTPYEGILPGPHGLDALKHCYSYLYELDKTLLK